MVHVETATGLAHGDYHSVHHIRYFAGLVDDRTAGNAAMLLASCIGLARDSLGKRLGVDVGGAKRLNALSAAIVPMMLVPLALLRWVFATPLADTQPDGVHVVASVGVAAVCIHVLNFYALSAANARSDHTMVKLSGLATVFVSAGLLEDVWQQNEAVKAPTLLATAMFCLGLHQLYLAKKLPTARGLIGSEFSLLF